jgi:hypothetical protein
MQIATGLSQQFAQRGLQFFKVNKTVTHVSVARPQFLDLETTPVSEGVRRIVEFINAHPKCSRRKLFEALAPSPAPAPIPVAPAEGEAAPKPTEPAAPTPEQTAVIADLHWLVHQGHVLEFANGMMDTAKKPLPRPLKPQPQPVEKPAEPNVAPLTAAPVEAVVSVAVHNEAGETPAEPKVDVAPMPGAAAAAPMEPAAAVPAEPTPEDTKA